MESSLHKGRKINSNIACYVSWVLKRSLLRASCSTDHSPHKAIPNYPDLRHHNNLMAKCLNREIWNRCNDKVTESGFTFDNAIQTGVDNPVHPYVYTVGCVAGDEEAYTLFAPLFDPVISRRHSGYPPNAIHKTDLDFMKLERGVLDPKYVKSCRVRADRNIRGYSLPPHCTRAERRDIEVIVGATVKELKDDFEGSYFSLQYMSEEHKQKLLSHHMMFDDPVSPLFVSAKMGRDWPDARGIFYTPKKDFLIWVNEEDHMRIISMRKGGSMEETFDKFCHGLHMMEDILERNEHEFMWNEHLGFINTCPSNLGTGLRASVHVHLPMLSQFPELDEILQDLLLQRRGTGGVETQTIDSIFDISNFDRLGRTEIELLQLVVDGVHKLVEIEKALERHFDSDTLTKLWPIPLEPPLFETGSPKPHPNANFRATVISSNFPYFRGHHNALSKVLTPKIYAALYQKKTYLGVTLDMCIQTGVDNVGNAFTFTSGIRAGDEECYRLFSSIFNPVVYLCHPGFAQRHHNYQDLDASKLTYNRLDKKYVLSCRLRTGRSIKPFPLPPFMNRHQRRAVEGIMRTALANLDTDDLSGSFHSLKDMSDYDQEELIRNHFLFKKPTSPILLSAGLARDWPDGRAIWHSLNKKILVWINEEEHVRIISMEKSSNMKAAFERYCESLTEIERHVQEQGYEYHYNNQLGYVTAGPSDLGTGLRVGIHLRIPRLGRDHRFVAILDMLNLVHRKGANSDVFDISNRNRLGYSEVQLVESVCDGVYLLVEMEKLLEENVPIDHLIPDKLISKYNIS